MTVTFLFSHAHTWSNESKTIELLGRKMHYDYDDDDDVDDDDDDDAAQTSKVEIGTNDFHRSPPLSSFPLPPC